MASTFGSWDPSSSTHFVSFQKLRGVSLSWMLGGVSLPFFIFIFVYLYLCFYWTVGGVWVCQPFFFLIFCVSLFLFVLDGGQWQMKVGGVCDRRSCSCNTNKQLLTNYHQGHGTESLQSWNNQTGKWANRSWRRNKNRHQSSERTEGKANKSIALVSKPGQTLLKRKISKTKTWRRKSLILKKSFPFLKPAEFMK